jgi:hypothetical protein
MALTFSQKLRMSMGNKAFRVYEVTHDGSTTTIEASDLDMNYIDYALVRSITALSSVADFDYLSGTVSGPYVTLANALSASAKCAIEAWGS